MERCSDARPLQTGSLQAATAPASPIGIAMMLARNVGPPPVANSERHQNPSALATKDELALVKTVEGLDFDYFVCSHGMLGKKADVIANIQYREELRAAVAKAIAAGQTLEQAQASVTMDAYKDWEFYEQQRPANVAGTYRALTTGR